MKLNARWRELLFQVIIHVVVFIFYSYDRNNPGIELYQVMFFLNYALAALVVNYVFLPSFFYRKKYAQFIVASAILVTVVIIGEEFVLEQIYFPETRGQFFPGVANTLLDVVPPIFILAAFKFAWDAVSKQGQLEELQSAMVESELQFLKSQINPHFLFNNLNNLYSYALERSPKAPELILKLSDVLRYMLYECREKYVAVEKEVAHLENFTRLNELQIEERGRIRFRADRMGHGFQIAPLILIVFIENAFKHSQSSLSEDIKIDVDISISESGKMRFKCVNNFQHNANTENLARGIGLQNVRKRLDMIYPGRHTLEIKPEENLYQVFLELDLNRRKQS